MRKPWLFALGAVAGAAGAAVTARKIRENRQRAELGARLRSESGGERKRIVILGAGFGGINAAHNLLHKIPADSGWTITLVDRRNYFLFTPLLYHAATGLVDPSHILFPVRTLSHEPHFIFREAGINGVDFDRKVVHLDDGDLDYDILVMAVGSITNFFGQEEKFKNALTLKTVSDGVLIRNRIIDAFEAADIALDPEERKACLTFAVVGGGATGIELMGAIRGLIHGTLPRQYPNVDLGEVRLLLFESSPDILPGLPETLTQDACRRLQELGIELRLSTRIADVTDEGVTSVSGEKFKARTVIWTAGVRPSPLADEMQTGKVKNGRLEVDPYLRLPDHPNVYAIGDLSASIDTATGKPLPPSAAVALQEGVYVAHDIVDRLAGNDPGPFHYVHRGELVSLGRHEAVAEVFGAHLKGFPAWVVWRAFYLSQLMGFKNRIGVALDWSFAYFYQRDTVRLDFPATPTGTERDQEPALNEPREPAPAESAPHAREWAAHPSK